MNTPRLLRISRAARIAPLSALMLVAAATLLTASCGGDGATTTTTTEAVTPTTLTGAPAPLADGDHFGFVRDVKDGTIMFEPAEFLTGEAALAAAREAGMIGESEDLPNDFYIAFGEVGTVELSVSGDATFALIGADASDELDDVSATFEELSGYWEDGEEQTALYGFVPGELPMTITVSAGQVTAGTQQYLP